jgi:hypothetical protein
VLEICKSSQGVFEQPLLSEALNRRDNHDQAAVHFQLRVLSEEMPPIVGNEDVIVIDTNDTRL